jgi:SPOR domain
MADRYQDRPFPADDGYDRGDDPHASSSNDSDPLAELARLIGQTDPFAGMGRANQPIPPRGAARDPYPPVAEVDEGAAAGPPPWMQRVARQEVPQAPQQDYPSAVHPLQRYATPVAAPEPDYYEPPFADADHEPDPSRYDDALYGQLESGALPPQRDPAYPDDPYGYQDSYDDIAEEPAPKRRGGTVTVIVVLALAVVGTAGAFAYRTYVGSPRSGEPPIIRADATPTKIVPAAADSTGKLPDRLAAGDGTEKIVPREEAPVDINANVKPAGPRMVFPPLNQNANPPSAASVAPGGPMPPANAGNGTLPNNDPRPVRTFSIRGDQPDAAATPVTSTGSPPAAKPAPGARAAAPVPAAPRTPGSTANANASSANAPLSLSPQAQQAPAPVAETRTRVANNSPVQIAPGPSPIAAASGGGYLVQVSSQKNEADAQASYRVLQGKYPGVLGSQSVLVKRVDLGEKGVYYRAFAGPFTSADQAVQLCNSLKAAGGPQCLIQRN